MLPIGKSSPFVIGLYYGSEKPRSAEEFLTDFVTELKDLMSDGLQYNGNVHTVTVSAFVCDAPARAFVKGVKSHSGYSSCEKCTVTGEYDGKVTFPQVINPLMGDQMKIIMLGPTL